MPKMATKPSGFPAMSNAATTPNNPNGATLSTKKSRLKL
jgi:hypothetical protein